MKGIVYEINSAKGLVAVLTKDAEFSVFGLTGGEPIKKGDEVHWENDIRLGPVMLINISQGEKYEVCFRNHWVSKSQLKKELQL